MPECERRFGRCFVSCWEPWPPGGQGSLGEGMSVAALTNAPTWPSPGYTETSTSLAKSSLETIAAIANLKNLLSMLPAPSVETAPSSPENSPPKSTPTTSCPIRYNSGSPTPDGKRTQRCCAPNMPEWPVGSWVRLLPAPSCPHNQNPTQVQQNSPACHAGVSIHMPSTLCVDVGQVHLYATSTPRPHGQPDSYDRRHR